MRFGVNICLDLVTHVHCDLCDSACDQWCLIDFDVITDGEVLYGSLDTCLNNRGLFQ